METTIFGYRDGDGIFLRTVLYGRFSELQTTCLGPYCNGNVTNDHNFTNLPYMDTTMGNHRKILRAT